jgi:tripartite-type tricarboxylate transporter receptor subunit TctC
MPNLSRRTFLFTGGAAAVGACSGPNSVLDTAMLQDTDPSRPMRLIVPAAAGTRPDIAARDIASALTAQLGEPVSVVNYEGSSPAAHAAIASAPADGRTLGLVTVEVATMHWRGLSNLSHRDFTPLGMVSDDPASIHVRADGPYAHARQLMQHVRANPGTLKLAGSVGGIWHLSTVGWMSACGLNADALQMVPSGAPQIALQDLAAGNADVAVCSTPEARTRPEARAIKTVAVLCGHRNPRYPDVATLQELIGVRYAIGAWRGVAAPKGLSRETAARLTTALRRSSESAELRDAIRRRGFRPIWRSGPEFAAFMEAEDKRLGSFVQAAGIGSRA